LLYQLSYTGNVVSIVKEITLGANPQLFKPSLQAETEQCEFLANFNHKDNIYSEKVQCDRGMDREL
jgi:hypothetical protein